MAPNSAHLMLEATGTERIDAALEAALGVLRTRPSALITDIDGTISRIVARPQDAVVSERARAALSQLAQALDLTAVVTAREERVARRLVGVEDLVYVGNYGLFAQRADKADLAPVMETAIALLDALPCVALEDKGVSFALHYRNCADPESVRNSLIDVLEPVTIGAGGRMLEGKMVVEIVPAALPDKAAAIAHLAELHRVGGIVYLGDDVSDLAVFQEIARRRTVGFRGVTLAVLDTETDSRVASGADLILYGVNEVEAFLERLAARLGSETKV